MSNHHNTLTEKLENLSLQTQSNSTGLVYDERMTKHVNIWDKNHSEVPERISRPYSKHIEYGLLDRCYRIPSRLATEDELATMHSITHIKKMQSTKNMNAKEFLQYGEECDLHTTHINKMQKTKDMKSRELFQLGEEYDSIYMSEDVYECALWACGCTLEAVEHVATNKVKNAVAIVRPPGHHADTHSAMGYCYFNNVAIAAKIAQDKWGMKRVLIVDWDIHHGNGTQNLFESDSSVLYFSIHGYHHAKFYPFSTIANYDVIGTGEGKGFNINVPWNKFHMGDADYMAVFQHVLLPIAYEFDPDIVLVSAGFDSARGDPKGLCDVSPEGYCHLTNMLMGLAGGKVVVILEGGYNLTSVEESLCKCTATLLGDPCPKLNGSQVPCRSAMESIRDVVNTHRPYWNALKFVDFTIPEEKKDEVDATGKREDECTSDLEGNDTNEEKTT